MPNRPDDLVVSVEPQQKQGVASDEARAATASRPSPAVLGIAGIANAWLPIETAPRDGTEVILYGPSPEGPRVTAGFWLQPDPPVVGDCGGECRCPEYGDDVEPLWCMMHSAYFMSNDGGFCAPWDATHWRPLPDPPAQGTSGSAQDAKRLDPKGAGPVRQDAPNTDRNPHQEDTTHDTD